MTPTDFTPLAGLLGGGLIGLAAVLLMALNGRIAGVSGYVSRLLPPWADAEGVERAAFVAGLIAAPVLMQAAGYGAIPVQMTAAGAPALVLAGLLVGFGATWGNGCTSGHGVCGLSRLSLRSLAATLSFMATAAATVFVLRHVLEG